MRSGRALYVGLSNYNAEQTRRAAEILESLGTPCLIHQPVYNMFNRWIEDGLTDVLEEKGIGCIPFSPLAQGLLTSRYLKEIPAGSRATKPHGALKADQVTPERVGKVRQLNEIAQARGQTMAQMAIAWILRLPVITSALIGASRVEQIEDVLGAVNNTSFSEEENERIEAILKGA